MEAESDYYDENEQYSDNSEVYSVLRKHKYMVVPELKLTSENRWSEVKMQIDNGSEVNCIRKQDLQSISPTAVLEKTSTKLKAYGDVTLYTIGKIELHIRINSKFRTATFLVVEDASNSLLSGHQITS